MRPGDTLIVRVDPRSTHEQFDELRRSALDYFAERCPDVELVVVAAEQLAVARAN